MGDGHDKSVRVGGTTGVSAEDITAASNGVALGVGKRNIVQTHEVGSQWIDHDAVCDGKDDSSAGCFLTDKQRMKLIIDFLDKARGAQDNYKTALEHLRVKALLEKDSDVSWVLTLALDVIGAHFVSVFARSLTRLRAGQLANLEQEILSDGVDTAFDPSSTAARMHSVLTKIPDKTIEAYVKTAVDTSKRQALGGLKTVKNRHRRGEENGTVTYIQELENQCDLTFQEFKDTFRGFRDDAAMVAIWEGMHPTYHSVDVYEDALAAKLQRFKHSGVDEIGRVETFDRLSGDADVYRDTRVIWLVDSRGNKTLWFQSQEGDVDYGVLHTNDPGSPIQTEEPWKFGPRAPREAPQLGKRVPDEFVESALLRSEAKWGQTPTVFSPAHDLAARFAASRPAMAREAGAPLPRLQLTDVVRQSAHTAIRSAAAAAPSSGTDAATTDTVAVPSGAGGNSP